MFLIFSPEGRRWDDGGEKNNVISFFVDTFYLRLGFLSLEPVAPSMLGQAVFIISLNCRLFFYLH